MTPELGMVSGTLEHRVADMRTSHSGSLSVPYIISTHVSVKTNQFKPGNVPGMEGYGNYNINIQASSLKSPDCVMGVNEV